MNNLEILLDVKELGRYQRKVMTPLDEAFDPDAIDGDGDGLVQDRTPFERPAIITAITETAQRISQGIRDASRLNQKRSHTVHRERLRGKSNSEIAETLVPNDYASLASSLTEMAIQDLGVDASPAAIQTWIQGKIFDLTGDATGDVFDFTPKHIRKLRKTIEKHLDELPMFRRLVDEYGMPPFFILKKGNFAGITSHGFGIGVTTGGMGWADGKGNRIPFIRSLPLKLNYFDKSGGSNKTKRWLTDTGIRGTVLHEYGHYLAGVLYDDIVNNKYGGSRSSAEIKDMVRYINEGSFSISLDNKFPRGADGETGRSIPDIFSALFQKPEWDEAWSDGDLPDELPHVFSFYGETNPSEQWAEGIAALLSTDPKQHKLVSPGFESMVKQLLELETDVPFHSQGSKYSTDVFDFDGPRVVLGSRGTDFTTPSGNKELWHPITKDMDATELAERIHPSSAEELISIMAEENHRITPTSSIEDHKALVGQVLMELFEVKSVKELESVMDLSNRGDRVGAMEQLLLDNPSMMLLHNQYGAPPLIHLTPEAYDDAARSLKGEFAGIHVIDPRLNIGTILLSPNTTDLLDNYNTPLPLEGESFQELLDNRPLGQRLVLSYAKWRGKYPKSVTYMSIGSNIEQLYAHEYGHYLHEQMTASLPMEGNRERRTLLRAYLSETWEEFFAAIDRPDWAEAYTNRRKKDLPDDYPFVDSAYAFTNPLEMFAESFAAATASDAAIRGAVSPEMNRQMAMMLGLDPEQAIYEQLVVSDEMVNVSLGISRPLGSRSKFTKKDREFWEKMFPDRTEEEWKEIEQQWLLDDTQILGGREPLGSAPSLTALEAIRPLDEVAEIEERDLIVTDDPTLRPGVRKLDTKAWDGKDIYQTADAGDALALIAKGHYVEMTHEEGLWLALAEVGAKWKEMKEKGSKGMKTLNACLFMTVDANGKSNNLFCRGHHDVARLEMPQIAGFMSRDNKVLLQAWKSGLLENRGGAHDAFIGGDKAVDAMTRLGKGIVKATITEDEWKVLDKKWRKRIETPEERALYFANTYMPLVEADSTPEFIRFLRQKGIDTGDVERVDVFDDVNSTQNELVLDKISGISGKMMEKWEEFKTKREQIRSNISLSQAEKDTAIAAALKDFENIPQNLPIIISHDGYIFDGHHRAFGRRIFESQLNEEDLKEVKALGFQIRRSEANISELLPVGKAYQDHMGVAPAAGGKTSVPLFDDHTEEIVEISNEEWIQHQKAIFDGLDDIIEGYHPTEYWKPAGSEEVIDDKGTTVIRTTNSPAIQTGTQSNEPMRDMYRGEVRTVFEEADRQGANALGSQSRETKPVVDYNEARKAGRSKIFRKKYKSRAEMYDGASTEQQVRLSVPRTPEEHMTMMLDATVDRLNLQLKLKNAGISDEPVDVRRFIDMSDPLNPRARIDAVQPLVEHVIRTTKEYEPDFSPEAIKQAEAMVTQTLNSSPSLRHFASEYGLPPVVIGSQNALDRQMIVYALRISKPNQELNSVFEQYQGLKRMMEETRIQEILDDPAAMDKIRKAYDNGTNPIAGAYINAANMLVIYPGSSSHKAFLDGKPIDPAYVPKPGDHTVLDNSIEAVLLHEYGHYFDQRVGMLLSEGGLDPESDMAKAYTRLHHSDTLDALTSKRGNPLFTSKDNPVIETTYGQTNTQEMVAEAMSAVFSHNPHAMEMLNKPLLDDVHTLLGIKSNTRKGVTERDLPWLKDAKDKRRELAGLTSGPLGSRPARNARPPRPTLKKLKKDKRYKKLPDETVKLSGKDYTFSHESIASDTFVVKHNGTTVGILNVGEGLAGEPRVSNLTVHGNHKTSGLEQGLVEFAHGYYPSLRGSKRTSEAFAARQFPDAFEDLPDGHSIIELPDGVPGSPEYVTSLSEQLKRAKRDKTVAVFEYNNELRRVTVDDVYEQNGQTYMKGFDSTRNDGRTFRVDRIFRPKTTNVVTEDGTKTAVEKKPKAPRKPVSPYTGKAEELFKGATSYREVHDRLTTGEMYFYDYETTGIVNNPDGEMQSPGQPVQLGITRIVDGKVVGRYNVYMNPGTPLSQWSKDNLKRTDPDGTQHPLTDEWLATQPPIADQIKAAFDFVGGEGKTFGGQYQIFDQQVMKENLSPEEFARWQRIAVGFIDSKGVIDHLFPQYDKDAPRDNRLGTMTKHFGVPLNNWHDASADAEASWAVIEAAVRRAAEREERGEPLQHGLRDIALTRAAHSDSMKKYDNQLSEFHQSVEQIKKEKEQASKALGSRSPKEKITTGTSKLKYVGKNTGSNEFFNENTRVVRFGTGKNTRNYLLYNDRDTIYVFDYDKSGPLDGWDPKKMPKAFYVGQMSTWNNPESVRNGEPKHEIFDIEVKKSHQRRGLATAMMTFYQEAFPERKLQHSDVLSEEGKAFRAATEAANIEDAAAIPKPPDEPYRLPNEPYKRPKRRPPASQRVGRAMFDGAPMKYAGGQPLGSRSQTEIIGTVEKRAVKAQERVVNLEKALEVLEKTGEWRGEEYGVSLDEHFRASFDLNEFDEGSGINLTAEEVKAKPDFISKVRERLEYAKDEQRLQEAKTLAKKKRAEQNTVDIEDLTPEQYERFKKLGEEVEAAIKRGETTDLGGSVVHVGQSELDGGVLDPSKTRGNPDLPDYSGNTGKLNTEAVARFEKDLKEQREIRDGYLELIEAINSGKKTFRPKTSIVANWLSGLMGKDFDVYSDFDLSAVSDRHSAMVAALEKSILDRESRIKDLELVEQAIAKGEGGKFGFVSAVSAEKGFQTGDGDSYFGRRASSEIPTDIAEFKPGSTEARGESRAKPRKDKIYQRWMASLRGTAYLVTDKEKITGELAPDMQGEKQIIGKVKPLFGVSAPRNASGVEGSHKGWNVVGMGLMATAARLEKEGKEVTIESVLAEHGTVNAKRVAGQEEVAKAGREAAEALASAGTR